MPRRVGSILRPENLGCFVETGDIVCLVCNPETYVVYLMVDERKLDLIREGSRIELFFPSLNPQRAKGTIVGLSKDTVKASFAPEAAVMRSSSIRAIVELDNPLKFAFHQTPGKAKIAIQKETVGKIVKRFFLESFRFEL